MANALKFTLEVNGLDIPEKAQAEISRALNQTLMHKIGELDLTAPSTKPVSAEAALKGIYTNIINPKGGRLIKLLSADPLNKEFNTFIEKVQGAGALTQSLEVQTFSK